MVTSIYLLFFYLNIYPLVVWICFLFYKYRIFTFLPLQFTFLSFRLKFHSVFGSFFALTRPSFNIFQKLQRILQQGLYALLLSYDTCMYAKKKNRPKNLFFYQNANKPPFLGGFRLRSTKLKVGGHIYIGQVKFEFKLIRTKNCVCFFAVDPI